MLFIFDTIELSNVDSVGIAITSNSGAVWTSLIDQNIIANLTRGERVSVEVSKR